jgi:hypothetical protein
MILTRRELLDGKHHVDVADDVVVLREHGALAVDHAVGRAALLAKVDDGVGLERGERLGEELPVADVADLEVDVLPGDLAPAPHTVVRRRDGRERVEAEGEVELAAAEVVDDGDGVAARREVEGGGPAAVAVAACGLVGGDGDGVSEGARFRGRAACGSRVQPN